MAEVKAHIPEIRFPEFEGGWEEKRLEAVTTKITSGSRDWAQYYSQTGALFVRMTNLPKSGVRLLLDDLKYVDVPVGGSEGERTSLSGGDILISITAELGKIGLVPDDLGEAFINQHTALVRPKHHDVNAGFTAQILAAPMTNKRLNRLNDSGAKSGLNLSTIKSFRLAFPSLTEQKKIAAFLGAVDGKLAALREKEAALTRFKQGLMQALFSQTLRFTRDDGSAYPEWETVRLHNLVTDHNSGIYKKKDLYGEGHNIVGVGDIFGIEAVDGREFRRVPLEGDEIERYMLKEGDILYAESSLVRSGIAKSVYVNGDGEGTMFAWHTRRFSVDRNLVLPSALYYYLESSLARKYITSVATQTALTGITTVDYFNTPIDLPHPEEQQKIADALSAMDAKIAAVGEQITRLDSFKKGLLQQMFV